MGSDQVHFTLFNVDKRLVKTAKSNWTFCFGGGVEVKAFKSVKFSVTIVGVKGVRAYIETDIVKKEFTFIIELKIYENYWNAVRFF